MVTINAIDSNIPIELSKGGTNATSFATATGIIKYDGTRLVTSASAKLDASNAMTNTSQPAFQAILSATTANDKTGNGNVYTLICDSETFDQGNNYDNTTGTFTAPVTGRYSFSCRESFNNVITASQFALYLTTSNRAYALSWQTFVLVSLRYNTSEFCDMDAGDTAILQAQVNTQGVRTVGFLGDATNAVTYFAGYLAW